MLALADEKELVSLRLPSKISRRQKYERVAVIIKTLVVESTLEDSYGDARWKNNFEQSDADDSRKWAKYRD
ncbi:hypothetical protein RND71_034933 [Anisodus tanguticus]|uniref:Uncharacterized protein n=1 Tax=Anisodus tanguticus TaxID=243964 RepID=A0AAE1R677_9SOLA|nr:hypothetical protein RND71_034933 [Anisodus tanguticus]